MLNLRAIGAVIRDRREDLELSQAQLGARVFGQDGEWLASRVDRLERGDLSGVTAENLFVVAEALGLTFLQFAFLVHAEAVHEQALAAREGVVA